MSICWVRALDDLAGDESLAAAKDLGFNLAARRVRAYASGVAADAGSGYVAAARHPFRRTGGPLVSGAEPTPLDAQRPIDEQYRSVDDFDVHRSSDIG